MREHNQHQHPAQRPGLYQEITDKIISQIEAGILPWVQPWVGGPALSMPLNGATHRGYSGINILLLWDALFRRGYVRNRWLTFKQALSVGGSVRKGEHGTTVVFADRFTPRARTCRAARMARPAAFRFETLHRFQHRPLRGLAP